MSQSAESAEAVRCLLCGRKAASKAMHRLPDVSWLRVATLDKIGLSEKEKADDQLLTRPYLCFSHYSRSDILIDESGSRRIRYGALPTKKSYDGKTSHGVRLSVKERISKRCTTNRTAVISEPPGSKRRSVSVETDGPPSLPQYSPERPAPLLLIRSYILIRYLPPLEGGKLFDITHKHCLTGNKAEGGIVQLRRGNGTSRQAVFLREFTDRSEAAREMLRQMGGVQQQDIHKSPKSADASAPIEPHELPAALMRVFDELGHIKSMLATVTANQSLILQHLLQPPPLPAAEAPALDVEELATMSPVTCTRKLSGMPRLTTMVGEGGGHGPETQEVGEKERDEESEQMATLQPMVKLEASQAEVEALVCGVKTEPSEMDDDDPPQMELCL